jgi:hypothetical protein
MGERHLPLRTFRAVEKKYLSVYLQGYGWDPALDGRDAAARAQKDELHAYLKLKVLTKVK